MYYIAIVSASPVFLRWVQNRIAHLYDVHGAIHRERRHNVEQLVFAKKGTRALARILYKNSENLFLARKHLKLFAALAIVATPNGKQPARMEKLVDSPL